MAHSKRYLVRQQYRETGGCACLRSTGAKWASGQTPGCRPPLHGMYFGPISDWYDGLRGMPKRVKEGAEVNLARSTAASETALLPDATCIHDQFDRRFGQGYGILFGNVFRGQPARSQSDTVAHSQPTFILNSCLITCYSGGF